MTSLWQWTGGIHVALGFVSLAAFWAPLVVIKGGRAHRRIGMIFHGAMLGLAVSALGLSAFSLSDPERWHPNRSAQASQISAIFLGYLAVVTLVIVHNGVASVRWRRTPARWSDPWRRGLNHAATAASVAALAGGLALGAPVIAAMSPVGFAVARGWTTLIAEADAPRAWLRAHIGATLAGGIAVHTAFLAGGGERFLPDAVLGLGLWAWLAPTAIGVPAMILVTRRFAPRG